MSRAARCSTIRVTKASLSEFTFNSLRLERSLRQFAAHWINAQKQRKAADIPTRPYDVRFRGLTSHGDGKSPLLLMTQLGHREGQRQSVNKYGVGSELWPEPFPGTAEAL